MGVPMARPKAVNRRVQADSFEDFYRREYRSVLGLAVVLNEDRWTAEDLTQEAFVAAEHDWKRVGSLDRPQAWVRRIVANKSVSRWRRKSAEARAMLLLGNSTSLPPEPHLSAETADLWRQVRALPKRQAQVLALTYIDGLPTQEVGEVLGCSAATVKTHLQRGRATLAKRLGVEEKQ